MRNQLISSWYESISSLERTNWMIMFEDMNPLYTLTRKFLTFSSRESKNLFEETRLLSNLRLNVFRTLRDSASLTTSDIVEKIKSWEKTLDGFQFLYSVIKTVIFMYTYMCGVIRGEPNITHCRRDIVSNVRNIALSSLIGFNKNFESDLEKYKKSSSNIAAFLRMEVHRARQKKLTILDMDNNFSSYQRSLNLSDIASAYLFQVYYWSNVRCGKSYLNHNRWGNVHLRAESSFSSFRALSEIEKLKFEKNICVLFEQTVRFGTPVLCDVTSEKYYDAIVEHCGVELGSALLQCRDHLKKDEMDRLNNLSLRNKLGLLNFD